MNPGRDQTPEFWGDAVRAATNFAGPWPRISIWHGSNDYTVAVQNSNEIAEQWLNLHGLDVDSYTDDTVDGQAHRSWPQAAAPSVELYTIAGMGHGVPIAPHDMCGQAGAFVLDVGICSARHSIRFWHLDASASVDAGQALDVSIIDVTHVDVLDLGDNASEQMDIAHVDTGADVATEGGPRVDAAGERAESVDDTQPAACTCGATDERYARTWGLVLVVFCVVETKRLRSLRTTATMRSRRV
jgi:hypothetical protein